CVQDVVRVFRAEAGKDDSLVIRLFARPAGAQVNKFGTIGDVCPAVTRLDTCGNQQPVGEDGGLVRLAVAVGIFEDNDLVVGNLPRLDLRVDLAGGDPQAALGVEVHLNRLGEERVGGEEVDLEPFGEDEALALQFRIGVGDLGVGLGEGDGRQGQEKKCG